MKSFSAFAVCGVRKATRDNKNRHGRTDCVLKTAPSLLELVGDKAELKKIRNVEITDLLPRAEVTLDTKVCGYLTGQTVLVTGGGGSIGSELCRQVAVYNPARIVIFANYENNAFTL
jgi:FlaA1/EpsC-like NDP-sugar epimerase